MRLSDFFGRYLSLFLAAVISVSAQSQPISNEQLVISSIKQAIVTEYPQAPGPMIQVMMGSGSLDSLIADGIADGLQARSAQVLLDGPRDAAWQGLRFDLLGFDFNYKKGDSRGFLRSRKIKRELNCQLRIITMNAVSGGLDDSRLLTVDFTDQIEPGMVRLVRSRAIPELAPDSPGSGWSKYLEPAVVVGSVGALVYLFFANR